MANEVFISYSRKDYDKVHDIKKILDKELDINCWMDLEGIESSELFEDVIISAINRHDIMLFMRTKNSMNSKYAWKEISYAKKKGKRIVLVILDNEPMTDKFLFNFGETDNIVWSDELQQRKLITNLKDWIRVPKKTKFFPDYIENMTNIIVLGLAAKQFESYAESNKTKSKEELKLSFGKSFIQKANASYAEGKYNEAFSSYLVGAAMGDIEGFAKLGDCYFMGIGVAVDMDKALKFYMEAASKGHKLARERVSWIKKQNKA